MPDIVTVRAGSKLVVEALVAGKPSPFCKWKQGNEDVLTSDRLAVVKTLTTCTLIIKNVKRTDSGYYSLSAENSTGRINQILRVTVMGQSEPPKLLELTETDDYVFTLITPPLCHCRHPWTPRSADRDHRTGHRCLHAALELPAGRWREQHHQLYCGEV